MEVKKHWSPGFQWHNQKPRNLVYLWHAEGSPRFGCPAKLAEQIFRNSGLTRKRKISSLTGEVLGHVWVDKQELKRMWYDWELKKRFASVADCVFADI